MKIFTILFIILSFGIVFISIFKKEWMEIMIQWLEQAISGLGYWNYLIIFISSLVEVLPVIGTFLPGQNILLIVGGFFGNMGNENLVGVIIVAILGAILGNYIAYILGKHYGTAFFEKYGDFVGIGKTEKKYLEKGINTWGTWGIIIGKFRGLTRSFLPFLAGSMGMKSQKFMFINTIGSILRALIIIIFGVIFIQYYKFFIDNSGTIISIIFLGIFGYLYLFKKEFLNQYMKDKRSEFNEKIEQSK